VPFTLLLLTDRKPFSILDGTEDEQTRPHCRWNGDASVTAGVVVSRVPQERNDG
jgi:hypothetical protein